MHGNRDSIMKPAATVWRYRRLAGGAGPNTGRRETLWSYLSGRGRALHIFFIKQRFMLAS
jgi:hypothetical protein